MGKLAPRYDTFMGSLNLPEDKVEVKDAFYGQLVSYNVGLIMLCDRGIKHA